MAWLQLSSAVGWKPSNINKVPISPFLRSSGKPCEALTNIGWSQDVWGQGYHSDRLRTGLEDRNEQDLTKRSQHTRKAPHLQRRNLLGRIQECWWTGGWARAVPCPCSSEGPRYPHPLLTGCHQWVKRNDCSPLVSTHQTTARTVPTSRTKHCIMGNKSVIHGTKK